MKRLLLMLSPALCLVGLAGCQCTPLTEDYADVIDHVAYNPLYLDALYHPGFDLTRIGQPDWCSCPVNRLWCRYGCCAANCGEPSPNLYCPFCLQERPVTTSTPSQTAPSTGGKMTPQLPPAPKPPDEPPPAPAVKSPASQDDELPTL